MVVPGDYWHGGDRRARSHVATLKPVPSGKRPEARGGPEIRPKLGRVMQAQGWLQATDHATQRRPSVYLVDRSCHSQPEEKPGWGCPALA